MLRWIVGGRGLIRIIHASNGQQQQHGGVSASETGIVAGSLRRGIRTHIAEETSFLDLSEGGGGFTAQAWSQVLILGQEWEWVGSRSVARSTPFGYKLTSLMRDPGIQSLLT